MTDFFQKGKRELNSVLCFKLKIFLGSVTFTREEFAADLKFLMNSLHFSSSLPLLPSLSGRPLPYIAPQCCYFGSSDHHQHKHHLSRSSLSFNLSNFRLLYMSTNALSNEGTIPVVNFEELAEKDWSFLEMDDDPQAGNNVRRIISAGELESTSKVLVTFCSEGFVDRLVDMSYCQLLLVVHDSLLVLACIKEKYDKVKCWQGELIYVPDKWAPFDVVYIYCLPALPFTLDQVFEALAERCLPGTLCSCSIFICCSKLISVLSFAIVMSANPSVIYYKISFMLFPSLVELLLSVNSTAECLLH